MDIRELQDYRLSDAVKFNTKLNPGIWGADEHLLPEVRERLLAIAEDFKQFLGIDLEVKDITISGSNAAYTYTPMSDIDLHLVADIPQADTNEVYREFFDAKKYQYNDQHDYRIGGADVELYVQNANEPHYSQGIYSIQDQRWLNVPSRRRPKIDDISVQSKYEDLGHRIEQAIKSGDREHMDRMAEKLSYMRKSGLETTGEFGAENLAFKLLRNTGLIGKLKAARLAAQDRELSLVERRGRRRRFRYGHFGGMWFPGYHAYGQTDAAADGGGDGGGGEAVHEAAETDANIIDRFAKSCAHFLGMERVPQIRLRRDPEWCRRNGTFGRYTADPDHRIELATAGRHIQDILRTLAHEMTHARQNEVAGLPADAGETGSQYEDSANAMAGRIMRHWAEQEPEMFAGLDLDEDLRSRAVGLAAAACIAGTPGCATTQGPGVADTLRTIQTIGRTAQNLPTRAGAEEELRTAIKDRLRQGTGTRESIQTPVTRDTKAHDDYYVFLKKKANLGRPMTQQEQEFIKTYRLTQQMRKKVAEASGYIPTEKERNDPRFSMALTRDVHPGQTGKEANKLGLKTDSQGRPALLMKKLNNLLEAVKLDEDCWDGYRQQGMKKKSDRMVPNCVKVSEDDVEEAAPGGIGWSHDPKDIEKIRAWRREETGTQSRVFQGYTMKFSPQGLFIYKGGDLVFQKPGDFSNPTNQDIISAKASITRLVNKAITESEEEELTEVKMSPAEFQKFLKSPAAEGIRAGFEAELIFRNTQSDPEGGGEAEPDYEMDERTGGIQDIIDFFTGGDNGIGRRAADRLSQELTEQFMDWAREQFANEYFDQDRFMDWAEENVWPDNEDHYREDARANLDDDATDEDVEREAVSLFRDDVERDWDRSGAWYEMASEELFDAYMGDLDESDWLDSSGLRYMSDVANGYDLDWPYWTDGSGSGGERDWNDISNSLATVTGMPVRVSGGYHGAARREGQYIIEPDSSLDSDDSDDYGLEIVSPPMPLPEAIEQLSRIIDWANGPGDAYTNSSTGLHMGVSLPYKGGDVDPIKLILFMGDRNLLETFGRESNTYARSAYERLESKIRGMRNAGFKQITGVLDLMKNNLIELADREMKNNLLGDKYVSVHPQDGYIEFRGPGGDYLAKESEIDGVLENTMLRLAYAMSIAGDNAAYRKEYAKKLYKVLTKDNPANPFMQLFADYSAGNLTGEQLKRQWADTVLQAERGDVEDVPPWTSATGEYEVFDRDSGTRGDRDSFTVIDTFRAANDGEAMAKAIENWSGKGIDFGVRAKVAEPEEQKPKSRRAELAQRVTRSTKDVGEQLWRVNHHSSVRWVTARSQAEAVKQAIQQDRAFNSAQTRARIASDLEKAQWNLDQERQRERDAGRDAAEIRARLGVPVPAGGSEEKTYRVTWTERRSDGERQDSLNVQARGPQNAMQRVRDALDAQGREVIRIQADEVTAPARDGEPIPGSTLDLARQRAQQAQGEWTGHWIVRDSQGRELTRFHGIGNAQSDANRHAAAWLGRNRPDLVGQDVDVVPEMR